MPRPPALSTRSRRGPPSWLVLVAGTGVALAMLGGIDGALRKTGSPEATRWLVDEETCYAAFTPNSTQTFEKPRTPLRSTVMTDGQGFRISGRRAEAPARCRMLCLGDSFTLGMYVEAAEAFPAVLESMLRARGYDVRVDNAGVQGNTIAQERAGYLLRQHTEPYSIVVVARTSNDLDDLWRARMVGCRLGGGPPRDLRVTGSLPFGEGPLGEALRLGATEGRALGDEARQFSSRTAEDVHPAGECASAGKEYLAEAESLALAIHADGRHALFVGLEPFFCRSTNPWDVAAFSDRYASEVGAAHAELLENRSMSDPSSSLAPLDGHPSPVGHRRIAEQLAQRLEGLGWLGDCR